MDEHGTCKLFPEFALVYEDNRFWIGIREYFPSDGGSLPSWTWSIIRISPFDPRCVYGFYTHDGIYGSHLLTQLQGDIILSNILCIEPRPNLVQRQLIYRTLRLVGHYAYNGKSEIQIARARKFVTVYDKQKTPNWEEIVNAHAYA